LNKRRVDGENLKNVYEGLKWNDIFPGEPEPEEKNRRKTLLGDLVLEKGAVYLMNMQRHIQRNTQTKGNPKVKMG
jgi:hypothetical protein